MKEVKQQSLLSSCWMEPSQRQLTLYIIGLSRFTIAMIQTFTLRLGFLFQKVDTDIGTVIM